MTDIPPSPPADPPINNKRKPTLLILMVISLLAGGVYAVYWWTTGQYRETTDNAYVGGDLLRITARSDGTVVAIHADEMDPVRQGQPLVMLNDADTRAALDSAKAELATAVRDNAELTARAAQLRSVIALREKELTLAKDAATRRETLARQKLAPEEEATRARMTSDIAAANLEVAKRDLTVTETLLQHTPLRKQPPVLRAEAQLREAYLQWTRSQIPAPLNGHIAKRAVQLGQRVKPGDDLMAMVPADRVWVDANFKEDQLIHLRIGQPVKLTADLYGNDVVFHGKVQGIALGTGSVFALLPAQNASGNWIKIVQRVPVRIVLNHEELVQHPLRLGLSMRVEIDTHTRDGAVLAAAPAQPPITTPVYTPDEQAIERMIEEIVRANATLPP